MGKDPSAFLNRAKMVMQKTDAQLGAPMKRKINEEGGYDPALAFESQLLQGQEYGQTYEQPVYQTTTPNITEAAKNLPGGIFESMMDNPIADYNPMTTGGLSVLDQFMPQQNQVPQQRQVINEDSYYGEKEMPTMEDIFKKRNPQPYNFQQPAPLQQTYQPQTPAPIDYAMINMMIEKHIAKEFSKLQKTMTNNLLIKLGKEIQLVDANGNVFKGELRKVGNINKK